MLPRGGGGGGGGVTLSKTMFVWGLWLEEHPHEHQEKRISTATLSVGQCMLLLLLHTILRSLTD